jgi:hypothetical protein
VGVLGGLGDQRPAWQWRLNISASDGLNASDSVAIAVELPAQQAADHLRETAISDYHTLGRMRTVGSAPGKRPGARREVQPYRPHPILVPFSLIGLRQESSLTP